MNLLKEFALVSHTFHQICSKYLFAKVDLHDRYPASSKKGFIKLVKSRPNVVNYIRKLTYKVNYDINDDDHLLSPILSNFLPTTSRLNCLEINASGWDWNTLDSSLTLAFLHLMRLPTVDHIGLSFIQKFSLCSLAPSVNLLRLDILWVTCFEYFDQHKEDGLNETMPKIREFHTSESSLLTTKLLHAKTQDGRPAFNFMDLRRLWMQLEDEDNIRYLMQNAKLLEKLHLSVALQAGQSLMGLHDIVSPIARTLKILELSVFTDSALCEGLEAMAGHYTMLEALSIEFILTAHDTKRFIGYIIKKVERVLVKPEWSALTSPLRRVSFKVTGSSRFMGAKFLEALQSLFNKYLTRLSKLESVSFNYSVLDSASVRPDLLEFF